MSGFNQTVVDTILRSTPNDIVDDAFVTINRMYFASENKLVRLLSLEMLIKLADEAQRRDASLSFKTEQIINTIISHFNRKYRNTEGEQ